MSRLDSAIRRLTAQKLTLEFAVAQVAEVPGPALELGLGNGRTYDHLRGLMPEREIFVFERQVAAHPDCIPDDAHLLLGDMLQTLPRAVERFGASCALIHCDTGTGDKAASMAFGRRITPYLTRLARLGAVVISDQPLEVANWRPLPLPEGVAPGRIHLYHVEADAPDQ